MTPTELQQKTINAIAWATPIFQQQYPDVRPPKFRVVIMNNRSYAGRATGSTTYPYIHTIEMNLDIANESPGDVRSVAIHEYAHVCMFEVKRVRDLPAGSGTKGHGRLWKALMVAFGLPPERCFGDHIKNLAIKTWRAECSGCQSPNNIHQVSPRQAGFMRKTFTYGGKTKNVYEYSCPRCKTTLKLLGKMA